MSIVSFQFFVFTGVFVLLYYVCPRSGRRFVLLAGSTIFIIAGSSWQLYLCFAAQVLLAYAGARWLHKNPNRAKLICRLVVGVEIAALLVVKENSFFIINANYLLPLFGKPGNLEYLNWAAPLAYHAGPLAEGLHYVSLPDVGSGGQIPRFLPEARRKKGGKEIPHLSWHLFRMAGLWILAWGYLPLDLLGVGDFCGDCRRIDAGAGIRQAEGAPPGQYESGELDRVRADPDIPPVRLGVLGAAGGKLKVCVKHVEGRICVQPVGTDGWFPVPPGTGAVGRMDSRLWTPASIRDFQVSAKRLCAGHDRPSESGVPLDLVDHAVCCGFAVRYVRGRV